MDWQLSMLSNRFGISFQRKGNAPNARAQQNTPLCIIHVHGRKNPAFTGRKQK
jgi:hypothetical protein